MPKSNALTNAEEMQEGWRLQHHGQGFTSQRDKIARMHRIG